MSKKSIIAKLLSEEDISVVQKKTKTAAFNVETRELILPLWKEEMSKNISDLFICHEIGHALYTSRDLLTKMQERKIDKSTGVFKRFVNEEGFENSPDMTTPVNGDLPGRVAKRLNNPPPPDPTDVKGFPTTSLRQNVYETIVMPPVKFFTANYDVTFWCQYTTQMNDMMSALISMYQNNFKRTFKLETDKGYWFVGFVDTDLASGNNSDDFTDDERLVRYSFSLKVGAYVIAPEYPGAPAYVRRTVSAPQISFSTVSPNGQFSLPATFSGAPTRNDPDMHILKDLYSEFDPIPGTGVGQTAQSAAKQAINSIGAESTPSPSGGGAAGTSGGSAGGGSAGSAMIGGKETSNANAAANIITTEIDPFTGRKVKKVLRIKSANQRKGETVLKEEGMIDLGDLFRVK